MSWQTVAGLEHLKFGAILPHPLYSPDLAPCGFFLFTKMKEHLEGHNYVSDDEVQAAVCTWLRKKTSDFFLNGM